MVTKLNLANLLKIGLPRSDAEALAQAYENAGGVTVYSLADVVSLLAAMPDSSADVSQLTAQVRELEAKFNAIQLPDITALQQRIADLESLLAAR